MLATHAEPGDVQVATGHILVEAYRAARRAERAAAAQLADADARYKATKNRHVLHPDCPVTADRVRSTRRYMLDCWERQEALAQDADAWWREAMRAAPGLAERARRAVEGR